MPTQKKWTVLIPLMAVLMAFSLLLGPVSAAESLEALEGTELSAEGVQLFNLINSERSKAGIQPLKADDMLTVLARLKAKDMVEKKYMGPRSPIYGTVEDMLKEAKVEYQAVGENLARATGVEVAHASFMRNSTLKNRVLNADFDRVGVALVPAGSYWYVVEIFIDDKEPGQQSPGEDTKPGNEESNEADGQTGVKPGQDTKPAPEPEPQTAPGMSADEQQMFNLVNQERTRQGLKPLQFDSALQQQARLKAADMVEKNYFSHTSPTYGSPFDMLQRAGIKYNYAGENLAMAPSVQQAHSGLMNSSGHRANILNSNYDRVGIAMQGKGYQKYFVQIFTGGQRSTSPAPKPVPAPQPTPEPQPQPAPNPEPNPAPQPQPAPNPEPNPAPQPGNGSVVNSLTPDEQKMFQLVNQERAKNGAAPLKVNNELVKLARLKAQDMISKNYFSHTSPTYGSPFDMMKQFGVRYSYAGENLAGAPTVSTAHQNLMNSSGHRKNILSTNFTEVGIGIVDGGPYGKMFVQMFIRP